MKFNLTFLEASQRYLTRGVSARYRPILRVMKLQRYHNVEEWHCSPFFCTRYTCHEKASKSFWDSPEITFIFATDKFRCKILWLLELTCRKVNEDEVTFLSSFRHFQAPIYSYQLSHEDTKDTRECVQNLPTEHGRLIDIDNHWHWSGASIISTSINGLLSSWTRRNMLPEVLVGDKLWLTGEQLSKWS